MEKNWIIKSQGEEAAARKLATELNIELALANLLIQRNVRTYDEAEAFFRPDIKDLHDPFLMKDMEEAVIRINAAIKNEENILVYGDYDVDGTTSVALIYSFFKRFHDKIDFYIPDRYSEGYGISTMGIDHAREQGHSLIIALDCGIKAVEKVKYAKDSGIDFIICDHHTPGDKIPKAVAVLDPKRADCKYPFKELSGCGVGFKLIQAYAMRNNIPFEDIISCLDLVAVSVASDIVSLTGENRILTHYGLKQLNADPRTGLKTIIQLSGIREKVITVDDIVYKIGPRINAAGRIESGNSAVNLLIAENPQEAKVIGERVNNYNITRRSIDTNITQEALDMINNDPEQKKLKTTVLFHPDWHKGVIGIVASRLIDSFYRPTVVLTESNGMATGSARSVFGFDLYQAIDSCSDLLENFGGHKYAAGLTLKVDNIPKFRKRFENFVVETIEVRITWPRFFLLKMW